VRQDDGELILTSRASGYNIAYFAVPLNCFPHLGIADRAARTTPAAPESLWNFTALRGFAAKLIQSCEPGTFTIAGNECARL